MNWELVLETFTSRDAGAEPTGMYSRRVSNTSTQFMPLGVSRTAIHLTLSKFKKVFFLVLAH